MRHACDAARPVEVVGLPEAAMSSSRKVIDGRANFAAKMEPKFEWVNVRQIIDKTFASLAPFVWSHGVKLVADVSRDLGVVADRGMLSSAVLNLAQNAIDAMPQGGRLEVTACVGRGGLELEIADSGPGLNDEMLRRAFEPFFTTKPGALGLGLALVRRIAAVHGGDVLAVNCPEGGAAFTLRFPQRALRAAA
jgi:two-component system sensor histidine kinase HydH